MASDVGPVGPVEAADDFHFLRALHEDEDCDADDHPEEDHADEKGYDSGDHDLTPALP